MEDSIDLFLASLSVNGCSQNTVRAYKSDLTDLLACLPPLHPEEYQTKTGLMESVPVEYPRAVVEQAAASFLTTNRETLSAATIQRKLSAFRRYGKWRGWPDFLESYRAPKRAPGVAHPIEQGVDGVLLMIKAARKPTHAALISLTGLAGLRVGEALKVRPSHIDETHMVLTVYGKGSKMRKVPLSDRAYEALLPCLVDCWSTDRLLVPLDNRTARRAITSVGRRCGMTVASHDMRMTFGTASYHKSGGNIRVVQELLGHASSHTTENYTQVRFDEMRQAADIAGEETE